MSVEKSQTLVPGKKPGIIKDVEEVGILKNRFLRKVLLLMAIAMLLNALLTGAAFTFTGRNVFANMKVGEMLPRAEAISRWTTLYQQGTINSKDFKRLVSDDGSLWDAMVHIFDQDAALLAVTTSDESVALADQLVTYAQKITQAHETTVLTMVANLGIIVGVPVYGLDGEITGAVFLTKPLNEVNTALNALNTALLISFLAVFVVMLLPTYFGSRSLTKPLTQMSAVAHAMAAGDFSVRAEDTRRDEIGQLGRSLNYLSEALSRTIGDLMIERNRLRNVLDGLVEGVIALDMHGAVTHINPAAVRLLCGKPGQSVESLPIFQQMQQDISQTAQDGQPRTRHDQAGEAELAITITQLQNRSGHCAGTIVMIQDETEAVRLEQTRRDYVANVSHELRTPIASIRSLADALNDGMVKKDEDKARYYGYILRESMRLSRLINDLLELSRLQSGGVAFTKGKVCVNRLLEEVAQRFSSLAEDCDLRLNLELPDQEIFAYSNQDRVEQVLVALVDNAVKYAAEEGEITLEAHSQEEKIWVSVRNTGTIGDKDLPHLFERFYKADKAHAEKGTGLGLAIAQEIMLQLGETIWAQNDGGDAVFTLTLTMFRQGNS